MGVTNEVLVENEEKRGSRSRNDKLREWLDIAEFLWSRRVTVFWWTLVGTALSGLIAYKICFYEATAQLMPPDSSSGGLSAALPSLLRASGASSNLMAGMANDMFGVKSSGALFAKVLQSRAVEDKLIEDKKLRTRYSWFGGMYWEDARAKLESRTKISEDKKSGVISVMVRDRDPALAKDLANLYVEQLDHVIVQVATSSAGRERVFLEQRLQEEKKTLADSEQRFSSFASNSMTLDVPEQTRVMLEASAKLQGELIVARSELKGLEETYTGENPRVKTVQARINELERELKRINGQNVTGDPASPYPSVKQLPTVGLAWAELYRDRKIHETVYEMLTQQYEMARVQEAREIPTVKVLDPAELPEKVHPRPVMVIAIGALVSMILACLGIHLQHIVGHRWNADDPRRIVLTRLFIRGKAS
ncbi:MAG TPA: GNVR domain-containing protein [Candidatus Angelobacter sp.]|nr:GNVR domain-containing protein [Candidatus Angelobacter sp.]